MALKRKHSSSAFHQRTTPPPISSTNAAENYLAVSAAEENERTRKRRRTGSFEKLHSLHFGDWSGSSDQATAPRNERRAEGKSSDILRIDLFLKLYRIIHSWNKLRVNTFSVL